MHRREFSRTAALSPLALMLGAAHVPTLAQTTAGYREGTDFLRLQRPAPVDAPAGKVEVVEFFWYSCPHCFRFEPTFDQWRSKAPAHVVVRRLPVAFRDDNVPQQRLYYALEAMGRADDLHRKVFHAVHVEKQRLNTLDEISAWMAKQGVDKAKFTEFYNSFGVAGKARRASQITDAYQVDGVPALGVAGRFFTSGSMAKSMERALQVVDHLVDLSRKA